MGKFLGFTKEDVFFLDKLVKSRQEINLNNCKCGLFRNIDAEFYCPYNADFVLMLSNASEELSNDVLIAITSSMR